MFIQVVSVVGPCRYLSRPLPGVHLKAADDRRRRYGAIAAAAAAADAVICCRARTNGDVLLYAAVLASRR